MVAIALAVAAVAVWYGFGRGEFRKRFAIQALISVLVLAPLVVPLWISLRSIAWESRVHLAVSLAAWHDLESELARRHAGWRILLVPPSVGLPAIQFATGRSDLDVAGEERLRTIVWALERWGAREVLLTGHASSTGRGPLSLAEQRVETVARWLAERGVRVWPQAIYPAPRQAAREREVGELSYRSVEIALAPDIDPSMIRSRP